MSCSPGVVSPPLHTARHCTHASRPATCPSCSPAPARPTTPHPCRAHRLWLEEQLELQRGIDLAIISTSDAASVSPQKQPCSPEGRVLIKAEGHLTPRHLLLSPTANMMGPMSPSMLGPAQLLSPTALGLHPVLGDSRRSGAGTTPPGARGVRSSILADWGVGLDDEPEDGRGPREGCRVRRRSSSGQEALRQRQLLLQQQLEAVPGEPMRPLATHPAPQQQQAHSRGMLPPEQQSPASPALVAVCSKGLQDCLDMGLLDTLGGHAHAQLHLATDALLGVGPVAKKARH